MRDMASPALFDIPAHFMRQGYYSDVYFWREKGALEARGTRARVTMQVFQKNEAVLCGVDEALAALRAATGRYGDPRRAAFLFDRLLELRQRPGVDAAEAMADECGVLRELDALWEDGFADLEIHSLRDGDAVSPWETVMHIAGEAASFAHLETVYLGILSRRTRVATNVREAARAANGKKVLFFPARHDIWSAQAGDGHAALVGGADSVSTPAQAAWRGARPVGTIPHALIAACGGDTVAAGRLFHEVYPDERLVALVDFDNDSVGAALACARALGDALWGVRLDTSEALIDRSMAPLSNALPSVRGVTPELAFLVRGALDAEGFGLVKIVVSGGFDARKIALFERVGAPVDAYGVGAALFAGNFDFTADVVLVNGAPCAKAGRGHRPNPRMKKIEGPWPPAAILTAATL